MPRARHRRARFSLEALETRNLLSTVGASGGPALGYLLPNPPAVTGGIQVDDGSATVARTYSSPWQ